MCEIANFALELNYDLQCAFCWNVRIGKCKIKIYGHSVEFEKARIHNLIVLIHLPPTAFLIKLNKLWIRNEVMYLKLWNTDLAKKKCEFSFTSI